MAELSIPDDLVAAARKARSHAHCPYSHYPVGAALRANDGRIYSGCNVENASYGLTVCAERSAIFQAVSDGVRDLSEIVIMTANAAAPCGACRQVLREFSVELVVYLVDERGRGSRTTLADLLPQSFGPQDLNDE